ncbi:MAG: AAA family ATPase [Desulfurococcaceae archaeon]
MHYLADVGMEYAKRAIAADKAGDYENAIKYYKSAIESFTKYLTLYPDAPLADFYKELVVKYKNRVAFLEKQADKLSRARQAQVEGNEETLFEVLLPENRSRKTFDDLVDLEEVKRALRRAVIYPVKTPELYPLGWPKAILLFGPPGCGKTELAIALANEIDAILINVTPAHIMSKWLGDAERNVKKLFETARGYALKGSPVIIFIDEVDALFQQYGVEVGGEKRARNQFLIEMDGLASKEYQKLPLFVIGATNKPWNLDIGFIRRFERRIYVPAPNVEVRERLFRHYISKLSKTFKIGEIDFKKLAAITENYSSADIVSIVKEVQNNIVEEIYEKKLKPEERVISTEDFIAVIERHKPSINPTLLDAYKEWNKQYGTLNIENSE